jgi:predicted membrane protein
MALIEVNWQPSSKDLRSFGTIAIIATVIIAALLYLIKGLSLAWCISIIAVGILIFISSRVSCKLTKGIYISLTLITLPIGMAVSFLLLGAFYYLVLTPIGLFFRLTGRDVLNRKFEPNTDSYWIKRSRKEDLKHYLRQF